MHNDLNLKMIAVIDLSKLRLYEAKGLKIIKKLGELPISIHKEPRHEKGSYNKGSMPRSAFEPRTSFKSIEHHDTAKVIVGHLEKVITHNSPYTELMIAAEAKTLGHIRGQLTNHLKKLVTKEVVKDLAHKEIDDIERAFFS